VLLGAALALKRRGRYGLLYIDGDADFYQPEVNPIGGAASASDLAFATGRGPDIVCDIEGQRPLVLRPRRVERPRPGRHHPRRAQRGRRLRSVGAT
jgi:hypothetical protein